MIYPDTIARYCQRFRCLAVLTNSMHHVVNIYFFYDEQPSKPPWLFDPFRFFSRASIARQVCSRVPQHACCFCAMGSSKPSLAVSAFAMASLPNAMQTEAAARKKQTWRRRETTMEAGLVEPITNSSSTVQGSSRLISATGASD